MIINSADADSPKISIITVVYNGERYIEETIRSVVAQSYNNYEYIIIDGSSTDKTLEIINKFESSINCLVSEPDDGMYDALFKGFALAHGEILCWINADDKLMPWALEVVANEFKSKNVSWVTGIPGFWGEHGELSFVGKIRWYPRYLIKRGFFHHLALGCIQQESTFFSKELYQSLGKQELNQISSFKSAGDYYLWRCFAKHSSLKTIPTVISGFRMHQDNKSNDLRSYLNEAGIKNFYFLRLMAWLPIRLVHVFASFLYSSYLYYGKRKVHGLVHYYSKKVSKKVG